MGSKRRRRRATAGSTRSQVQRILRRSRDATQVVPEMRADPVPLAPRVIPPLAPESWPGQFPRGHKRGRR